MQTSTVYSAKVNANDGFSSPASLPDLPGWTVFKQGQTEIYVVTHDFNLPDPERDMHIVATSMSAGTSVVVGNLTSNSFTVSAWTNNTAPTQTDFMFIATHAT